MNETPHSSPQRLRRLRLRFSLLWALFFLMLALVLVLALFSWRRATSPPPLALNPHPSVSRAEERILNGGQRLVKINFSIYHPVM